MIEKWLKTGVSCGRKALRRAAVVPAGVWITATVVALVGGRAAWKAMHRPANLDALAEESGNLNFMLENEKPQVNHAGTRLLFCHSSEKGVGVFVADIATGKKKMLFEEKEVCFGLGPHGVLTPFPWSPNDRWFVYAHQGPGAINGERAVPELTMLTICRADTDEEQHTLLAPFGRVVALEWLDADSFVYVSGTEAHDIMLVKRLSSGVWRQSRLDTPATTRGKTDNRFCSLGVLSSNSIAWLQANALWKLEIAANKAEKLCDLPGGKFFTSFDYSARTRQFMFSCVESNADSLWTMRVDEPGSLSKIASDIRTHDNSWNDVAWINDGRGCAYIRRPGLQPSGLMMKKTLADEPVLTFPQTYIQYATVADGGRLFVVGDIDNQPGSAIWEFNANTGERRCVVPGSDAPLKHLKHIPIRYTNIRLPSKTRLNVVVFPPPDFDRSKPKKYPLVIASIRFVQEDPYLYQYPEAIANAGAYVAVIDHTWSPKSLGSWAYYLNQLREYLSQFPAIDTERIYAVSISAQAGGLTTVLTNAPGDWSGTISWSPPVSAMPSALNVAAERHPLRALITSEAGMGDPTRLQRYQTESCANGMRVEYIVHPETPHSFIAKRSQRARIQAMLHFLFDD